MSLVINRGEYPNFVERIETAGVTVMSETEAAHQDISTLNFGLANLMPAKVMKDTEVQWMDLYGSDPVLQVRPHFVKLNDDPREALGKKRRAILEKYSPLDLIRRQSLDILVVTGDNQEVREHTVAGGRVDLKPAEENDYYPHLQELFDYSEEVPVTVFSCLAAHYALKHFHGILRNDLLSKDDQKVFGVFEHKILNPDSPVTRGMGDTILAPHSRWGDVSLDKIASVPQLEVLAASDEVGWLILQETLPNGNVRIYLQGHPEYEKYDLEKEYQRDASKGKASVHVPKNYYPKDDPTQEPIYNWPVYARALNKNILGIAYRIGDARRRATGMVEYGSHI